MLIDQNAVFSDKQPVAATAVSTHTVDQSAAGDARAGLYAVLRADETFTGVSELTAEVQTSDAEDFASPKTLLAVTVAGAGLVKDAQLLKAAVPAGALRYLRMKYTVTGAGTAGKLSAFLTDMPGL